eukprot:12628339-Alexandrium_andersonii.AAC.1
MGACVRGPGAVTELRNPLRWSPPWRSLAAAGCGRRPGGGTGSGKEMELSGEGCEEMHGR